MRKKLLSISFILVVSMFMTSCIFIEGSGQYDDDAPQFTNVAWQIYNKIGVWEYENENGEMCEGVKMDIITFYLENGFWTREFWTREYRSSFDTIRKMAYFDYTFDTPHGTIYIGENEWLDESYSFTYDMGAGKITLYSNDGDTLRLMRQVGW